MAKKTTLGEIGRCSNGASRLSLTVIREKNKQGRCPAFKFLGPVVSDFSSDLEWRD
jgi:hypothetical protein